MNKEKTITLIMGVAALMVLLSLFGKSWRVDHPDFDQMTLASGPIGWEICEADECVRKLLTRISMDSGYGEPPSESMAIYALGLFVLLAGLAGGLLVATAAFRRWKGSEVDITKTLKLGGGAMALALFTGWFYLSTNVVLFENGEDVGGIKTAYGSAGHLFWIGALIAFVSAALLERTLRIETESVASETASHQMATGDNETGSPPEEGEKED